MNNLTRQYLDDSGLTDDDFFDSSEYEAIDNADDLVENNHCLQLLYIILTDAIEKKDKPAVKQIRQDIQRMKESSRKLTNNIFTKEMLTI